MRLITDTVVTKVNNDALDYSIDGKATWVSIKVASTFLTVKTISAGVFAIIVGFKLGGASPIIKLSYYIWSVGYTYPYDPNYTFPVWGGSSCTSNSDCNEGWLCEISSSKCQGNSL